MTNSTVRSGASIQLALTLLQSGICAFGLIGNITTLICLYWFHCNRKAMTRMSLFILHLCIADISVSLFNVGPSLCMIASYPDACPYQASDIMCKAVNYLSLLTIYGSSYVLVMTALDRLIAIRYPFWAQRLCNKHVHIMCLIAWVISTVFSIPQLVIFSFDAPSLRCRTQWHNDTAINVRYEKIYVAWFAAAVWIVPTIIIAGCYVSITVVIWRRDVVLDRHRQGMSAADRTRMVKPLKITFAVIVGYVLCWSPYMISMLIHQFSSLSRDPSLSMYDHNSI